MNATPRIAANIATSNRAMISAIYSNCFLGDVTRAITSRDIPLRQLVLRQRHCDAANKIVRGCDKNQEAYGLAVQRGNGEYNVAGSLLANRRHRFISRA